MTPQHDPKQVVKCLWCDELLKKLSAIDSCWHSDLNDDEAIKELSIIMENVSEILNKAEETL
jgi:hypothetical protein